MNRRLAIEEATVVDLPEMDKRGLSSWLNKHFGPKDDPGHEVIILKRGLKSWLNKHFGPKDDPGHETIILKRGLGDLFKLGKLFSGQHCGKGKDC